MSRKSKNRHKRYLPRPDSKPVASSWTPPPTRMDLPLSVANAIFAHAAACVPDEMCGFIAADEQGLLGTPLAFYPVVNAKPSPGFYEMDDLDQLRVLQEIHGQGQVIWAIVHSHPYGTPYPSMVDTGRAAWEDVYYLITSLRGPRLRAYRFLPHPKPASLRPWDRYLILEHEIYVVPDQAADQETDQARDEADALMVEEALSYGFALD